MAEISRPSALEIADAVWTRPAPPLILNGAREPSIGIATGDVSRWIGRTPPEVVFAVADMIPSGAVSVLGGDGGAGKGVLLQTASTCISLGLPFLGKATRQGHAVYISAEDPEGVLHARQHRINRELDVDMSDVAGKLFIKSTAERELFLFSNGKPTALAAQLEEELAGIPDLAFVGIDSATLVYDDEEVARRQVGSFMRGLNRLAGRLSTAIAMLLHTSKSSDDSPAKAFSGSTSWTWQARAALLLKAETKNEPPSLTLIKSNYSKPGAKVELRWTENHVLTAADAPAGGMVERLGKRTVEREVLARVAEAWQRDNPLSPTPSVKDRYLPGVLARAGHKAATVQAVMVEMLDTGVLVVDQRVSRTPRGLRIGKAPDWYEAPK